MTDPRSWPFEQARQLANHVGETGSNPVVFSTGYGPSGAPHIGTFAEVVRTTMVRKAFADLTGRSTELLVVSDDYDAMRRVPQGLPPEMEEDIGLPLSEVRDPMMYRTPVGLYKSFAHRNNAALIAFVQQMGIWDFEFVSASDRYRSGAFNNGVRQVLAHYDEIMDVMLPTLGEERRATYSPFLPRDLRTRRILQIPMVDWNVETGEVIFRDGDRNIETSILNGACKLQWKVDWAMRWYVLGTEYEMSGKDLIDSVKASSKIVRIMGGTPPVNMTYELFLDEHDHKISKSKGNGLSVEDWLRYGSPEALSYFMFQNPRAAKSLHTGLIPKVTDEYLKALTSYAGQTEEQRRDNPVWHIHAGNPPAFSSEVSYGLLINLASVSNATDPAVLADYLATYRSIAPEDRPIIDELLPKVIAYCEAKVFPEKQVREATGEERVALLDLVEKLEGMADGLAGEAYQFEVYEVGKAHYSKERLREWFKAIYEVIFGSSDGPRFGTFIAAYGRRRSIDLIRSRV